MPKFIRRPALSLAPAVALLGACTLPPEGIDEDQLMFYDNALVSISCDLRFESDYAAVEFQTGLTREQINAITEYKLQTEEVVLHPEGGYRLNTGPCETNAETPAS